MSARGPATAPMSGLSLAQIRARLILTARWIVVDHAPARDGRCRWCRVADCPARRHARAYLALVGDRPPPTTPAL